MKKLSCLFLTLVMSLLLFGCAGKEAAAVDAQILALGNITLESEQALLAAEEAYANLSPKAKTRVVNRHELETARVNFDALQCRKHAEELETIIHDLRPITLKSTQALKDVEKEYNEADVSVKLQVTNFDDLVTGFQAYRMIRIDLVEKKISAIGKVTAEKAEIIKEARAAFDDLDDEEQSWVYNTYVLAEAERELEDLKTGSETDKNE